MKILVVAHFQNDHSPCAVFIHDQVKAYKALGHSVHIIVPVPLGKKDYYEHRFMPAQKRALIDGIEYVFFKYLSLSRYGQKNINSKFAIISLKHILRSSLDGFAPDIIHAHTLGFDSEIGYWLKNHFNCRLVVTTHGSDTNIPLQNGNHFLLKQWCDKADAIVCVGSKLKTSLLGIGVTTKLYVVPNGFNALNSSYNVEKRPNSIIQVGNLVPSKRTDITIQAFKKIKEDVSSATLTIVGEGPEKEHLVKMCKELDIEDSVVFTGQIPNTEVLKKMAASEYFVMVSSPEGFGIVYLEAMASKCLTIGAVGEGIADIISSGENGILLPIDDPNSIYETIVGLVKHPEEREKISQRGYETARPFTWENNAKRNIEIYKCLLSTQR